MAEDITPNETKNWTQISSYGPKFQPITGIILSVTYFVVIFSFFIIVGNPSIQDIHFGLYEITMFMIFIVFIFYIPVFVLGKGFGPNNGRITLYEEGFIYKLNKYRIVSKWKDVVKIEIKNEIPVDKLNHIIGFFISKENEVEPRLVARIHTKNGDTKGINGFISGKYILPQEIQTLDLSVDKRCLMNEHCANMLYCIARRAVNADWTGELSGINGLGWDIKIPETMLL